MTRVLVLYFTRGGHTAKIASAIAEQLRFRDAKVDLIDINSAAATCINWPDYDVVALGACVLYGTYDKSVFQFIEQHAQALGALPNSFSASMLWREILKNVSLQIINICKSSLRYRHGRLLILKLLRAKWIILHGLGMTDWRFS